MIHSLIFSPNKSRRSFKFLLIILILIGQVQQVESDSLELDRFPSHSFPIRSIETAYKVGKSLNIHIESLSTFKNFLENNLIDEEEISKESKALIEEFHVLITHLNMLIDNINIESQDVTKNIYIDNLLFVAWRNPIFYDKDQEGGNRKKRNLTDKIQPSVMRE